MPTKAELQTNRSEVLKACLVHVYTALGLPIALAALISAAQGDFRGMFLLFMAAIIIDGTDGPLARRFNVSKWTPRFDGRKLDDITDYLTYVFVPMFFMWKSGLVIGPWVAVLMVGLLASGYGFSNLAAKTDDKHFTGFPSYWNVLAFFLYLANLPVWLNGLIILVLAILVFVPIKFESTQALTKFELLLIPFLTLGCFYVILFDFNSPPLILVYALTVYPIYHIAHAVILYVRGDKR